MNKTIEELEGIVDDKNVEIEDLKNQVAKLEESVDKYYRALDEINDIARKLV